VRDAHDRYANIEVAYLLQKIELHDGVVMLASNLAKNMDPAFSRRIHYSLEFPRPAAADRERLWRGMFGARAPLAEDVDFAFLGRQFDVTGGEIRTMALDAAMLAASGATAITMATLVRAVGRHLVKQGRIPASADFKQHFGLLGEAAARNREQRA
jgi:ATP-dependent 26S proteasome regulatory subunit